MQILSDILMWICIGGAVLFFMFMIYALCVIASRNEYISERDWNEYMRKEGQEDGCEEISEAASKD